MTKLFEGFNHNPVYLIRDKKSHLFYCGYDSLDMFQDFQKAYLYHSLGDAQKSFRSMWNTHSKCEIVKMSIELVST